MPKGRECWHETIPERDLAAAVQAFHEGAGPRKIMRILHARGHDHLNEGIIGNCFSRARHHGDRGDTGEQKVLREERLGKIADLLQRSGIDPEDVGKVQSIRLSEWQGLTKDADGEAQKHDLAGSSVILAPTWDEGPRWPPVQPAAPTTIEAASVPKRRSRRRWRTAVVLPDPQIGYRRDPDTGDLDPLHDRQAIDAAFRIMRVVEPDEVVWLGDYLDLPMFGRFTQEAAFANTAQATIDEGHRIAARARATAPNARHRMLEGNHDVRLQKFIRKNALAAFGLRRADTPESWPALSVPSLLRLDDLNIEYLAGYPANELWLNDNLRCVHGLKVRSASSTAAAVIDDERVSTLFGHVHRIELMHRTRHVRRGPKTTFAATPGCLCRIDGAVPSTKSGVDLMGRPITSWENWQHGCAVVTFQPGDGRFSLELVPIHDGKAVFRGEPLR